MKKFFAILALSLCLCILVSCAGTPVIYHDSSCDCPNDSTNAPAPEGALKTGLAVVTSIKDSTAGEAKHDVTMVAVLVDDGGVIRDCIIDGIAASVKFDNAGNITSDLTAAPQTKNELGDKYGMVQYGGAKAEWNVQAQALADFAVGKTAESFKNGAVDESGKAPAGSDLASSATIYLGGYVSTVEKAVKNATHLGAMSGDELRLAAMPSISSSASATAEKAGNAQLDADVTALTLKDGVITSCVIDSVQAKVEFDSTGTIKTDLSAAPKTKNELGSAYGMVAYAAAKAEWNEQAASFAKYVTGKTPDEVAGIAVNEKTAPTDADLSSSVTIAIGGFQALIGKAVK